MIPTTQRNRTIDRILRVLRRGNTFFLSGHEKPDGDTVGCELAFASLLRRLGKKVVMANAEPLPPNLRFLPGIDRIRTSSRVKGRFDVAIIFECTGQERMGNILNLKSQAGTVINIDHHRHHALFGDINLIDPDASSNSEILYFVFQRSGLPLTKNEATALYVGLVTDCGRFQQENTNPQSHAVASELLKAGVEPAVVSRHLFGTRSESSLRLLARGLGSLRLESKGRIALVTLSEQDFRDTGADTEDVEDLLNQALLLPSAEAVLMVRPATARGFSKASLRGKGAVDLLSIAVSHGGGGHRNACGCTLRGEVSAVADTLLRDVAKSMSTLPERNGSPSHRKPRRARNAR